MPLSDEDVAALRADLERVQRERETALKADLKRVQREKETMQREIPTGKESGKSGI